MSKIPPLNSEIQEFEKAVANYSGRRYAVVCSSGRSAIRFSLLALGVGQGHEVIIPDFTCQILPLVIISTGAMPKFCDIDRNTVALSSKYLTKVLNKNTKAIVLVHPFGLPVNPTPFIKIAKEKGIAFIEDAAQALGAAIEGKKVGSFGDIGIFSFNKFLSVNSGSAIVTDNKELDKKLRSIRQSLEKKSNFASMGYKFLKFFGLESEKMMQLIFEGDNFLYQQLNIRFTKKHLHIEDEWVETGPYLDEITHSTVLTNMLMAYSGKQKNYTRRKLEPMEISFLHCKFNQIEKNLQNRKRFADFYKENLTEENIQKLALPEKYLPSYMRYPIVFSNADKWADCITNLAKQGFMIDYTYRPLHTSPFLNSKNKISKLNESIYMSKHLLPLPVQPPLTMNDIEKITSIVNSCATS